VRPGDVVVNALLAAAQAGEIRLRQVRAGAVQAVGLVVVDALYRKLRAQLVPVARFVRVDLGPGLNYGAHHRHTCRFAGDGVVSAITEQHQVSVALRPVLRPCSLMKDQSGFRHNADRQPVDYAVNRVCPGAAKIVVIVLGHHVKAMRIADLQPSTFLGRKDQ
jgi:hypothetical protein